MKDNHELPGAQATRAIILDTDMSPDSWLAVLFCLQRSDADVRAITIAGTGESHSRPGVRNAIRLAGLTRRPDVPIAGGRETPLQGTHRFPLVMRWLMDRLMFLGLPAPPLRPSSETALDLLESTIEGSDDKVTLIAVGGLTNTAELLQEWPALADRLQAIYIMGGAVDVPGNIQEIVPSSPNAVAEWNIYTDPYAASLVLQSGVPVTLVPLDATNQIPVSEAFRQHLQADQTTPAAQFASRILHRLHTLAPSRDFFLWDPMTVAVGLDDSLGTFEQRNLRVITDDGPQSGRTVDDAGGASVRVCKRIDQQRFEDVLIDALNGRVG